MCRYFKYNGRVFTFTKEGRAAYLYRVEEHPPTYEKASEDDVKMFRLQHSLIWGLVEDHMGLAADVLRKVTGRIDEDMLYDLGVQCLLDCARCWKPHTGVRFTTYAYSALSRRYLSRPKRLDLDLPLDEDALGITEEKEEEVEQEVTELVLYLIGKLPDEERALLELYYLKGFTMEELAETQEVAKSTVSRRIKQALAKCRSFIET